MTTEISEASTRWTITVPDDETRPAGPIECLHAALARLGPFRHKFHEDAQRLGPWDGLNSHIALSEQLAIERIIILATSLNRHLRLDEKAPRTSNVLNNLKGVEEAALVLAERLDALDDVSRHRLQTAGTGINGTGDVIKYPLMDEADVTALPQPAEDKHYPIADSWVRRLVALSAYANRCQSMMLLSEGKAGAETADKGGNTNLYKSLYGNPRWSFVNDGWYDFELFKPGSATGTEGGPFHLFLLDVFEYATGLDPEEHSKLAYWLKRVPKVNRRYNAIVKRQTELNIESNKILHEGPILGREEWLKRSKAISAEYMTLEKERLELWPELYPHSQLKKAG